MSKKLTTEEFIEKARSVHGDKYDYSKVEYKNNYTKVIIICKIHGEFEQQPNNHFQGKKCIKCSTNVRNNNRKLNTNIFIEKAKQVHGNKYIYTNVNYINTKTKVDIVCKIHGSFKQYYYHHLNGSGCPKCLGHNKTTKEVIRELSKIHNNKYDYSELVYINGKTPLTIICPIHGKFEQYYSKHIIGRGCQSCGGSLKKDKNNLIDYFNLVHDNLYDYSKVEYKGMHTNITIICPKHGEFNQRPNSHYRGCGCPKCSMHISKSEFKLYNTIKDNYNIVKHSYRNKRMFNQQHLDIFIPEYNIAIEYQGIQHFKAIDFFGGEEGLVYSKERDERKRNTCIENNIKLYYFTYNKEHVPKDYPYKVFTNEQELLEDIKQHIENNENKTKY